jgi:alanine racemase
MSQVRQPEAGRAGALVTINLQALRSNYRYLKKLLGNVDCGAAVKADAYGLGAVAVSTALIEEGCRHFFVAQLEEAITLRENLPVSSEPISIYVMHGSPVGYEKEFLEYGCTPVLNSLGQIAAWRTLAQERRQILPAIIQVDTGMSRMGMSQSEVQAWLSNPSLIDGIQVQYVMSHLACAENQQNPMNQKQLQKLTTLLKQLPVPYKASFANSSGIFLGKDFHFDLARPGAALYGVAPVAGQENPMQAVVQLQGRIIQVREISAGSTVGYSTTWTAQKTSRIATVSVGYADGWLRSLSNCGVAHIAGYEAPIVGNVSMDTITFDVTHIPPDLLAAGVLVDLLSSKLTVDEVAQKAKTIGYEILTSMGSRYQRHYLD